MTLNRIDRVIGYHLLTDPAASTQAALESHSWTRQPQFSAFSQSQTGQHAAAATSQTSFRATTAAAAASKPWLLLLLQRKGYSSLGVKWLQTSPVLHVRFPANL